MGGGCDPFGDMELIPFAFSSLLTLGLGGKRPLTLRFAGRGVSTLPSLPTLSACDAYIHDLTYHESSPGAVRIDPIACICLRYRLICVVISTSLLLSLSVSGPLSFSLHTSGGGNESSFPSNFSIFNELICPSDTGNRSSLFLDTASTFNDFMLLISSGKAFNLFRLRSRTSNEDRSSS